MFAFKILHSLAIVVLSKMRTNPVGQPEPGKIWNPMTPNFTTANRKTVIMRLPVLLLALTTWLGGEIQAFQPTWRGELATGRGTLTSGTLLDSPSFSQLSSTRQILDSQVKPRLHTNLASSGAYSLGRPLNHRRRQTLHKDVLIIGGGLAGLSVAFYLSQLDPERQITILDQSEVMDSPVGTFAAAGMLAPSSERLPKGRYLDLCMASKRMFPEFVDQVECLARESGDLGAPYLVQTETGKKDGDKDVGDLEPWNIGYVASGGFLAPAMAGDTVATWAPPEDTKGTAMWLDAAQVRELEPNLHPNVIGGWWFPEDASVDSRRLAGSLRAACVGAGVQLLCGKSYEVSSLDLEDGNCRGLWLKTGKYLAAKSILVANGAWMRTLLPVPIEPHKGQSIALRMPKDRPPILRRVLFGQDSYIVPKADGRIVIGATVEAGRFDGTVTPAGLAHILDYALELVPGLADLPLDETWAGLRPTTPDKGPILGETPWKNLFLAGGYWRNGVLLAPKTGELMAALIAGYALSEEDQIYLRAFSWDRFTAPGTGAAMTANARYAASMYPVHSRKSGAGVSAAVGTELGSYSTAVTAGEERRQDREQMFGGGANLEDTFERAANMGKQDGSAFTFGENDLGHSPPTGKTATGGTATAPPPPQEEAVDPAAVDAAGNDHSLGETEAAFSQFLESPPPEGDTVRYDGSPDALTVGVAQKDGSSGHKPSTTELKSLYESIQENKSKEEIELDESSEEERPDPGFRIYHVDEATGIQTEVPPYTSPGEFLESLEGGTSEEKPTPTAEAADGSSTYDETTYDGYQDIVEANAGSRREDELKAMTEARKLNRT